jgi:hypothetical protein
VDPKSVRLVLDGREVTSLTAVTDTSLNYGVDLDPGQHVVLLELRDTSGNRTSRAWQFTIAAPEPTATLTPTPSLTPSVTPTGAPTGSPTPTPSNTPIQPPVVNFSANQTVVDPGTPVLLSWNVQNADLVYLGQEKVDPNGTRLVTVNTTTVYHLIANNSGGTTDKVVTITVQQLPDLIVNDISLNASNQLVYTIKNNGTGDVTQMFLIQVYQDGLPIDSKRTVTSLPSGQPVTLFYPYSIVGTHAFTVRVNSTKEIPESNYNNNELTVTIVGPTVTPTFTVTFTPTNTPTNTPTSTNTPTNTPTPSNTPTSTNTPTNTPTPSNTPTSTPTNTPTKTPTPSRTPTTPSP